MLRVAVMCLSQVKLHICLDILLILAFGINIRTVVFKYIFYIIYITICICKM